MEQDATQVVAEANPCIDLTTGFQGMDARTGSTTSCDALVPNSAVEQPGLVPVEQFENFQDDQVAWKLG